MTPLQLKPAPAIHIPTPSYPPFQLFDLSVATDFPFQNKFPSANAPPNLRFTCQMNPPLPIDWQAVRPLYISQEQTKEGITLFSLYAAENTILLRFSNIADFYLWSDVIVCHLLNPAYEFMVEICFLGTVIACWFELQGVLALHAAASVIDGEVAAFLSSNKGGKTSLAAAFMQQGYPLLTDDILLIEQQDGRTNGRSGYPQIRMWPEQAELLFGSSEAYSYVHPYLEKRRIPIEYEKPGSFLSGRFPLIRCYIPERYTPDNDDQAKTTIAPIPTVEALLALAGYSFLFWLVEAIGLQPRRLKTLAQIVQTVPVSNLSYPDGVAHLPAVCQAVIADLQAPNTTP
jgi:hypothetical protein